MILVSPFIGKVSVRGQLTCIECEERYISIVEGHIVQSTWLWGSTRFYFTPFPTLNSTATVIKQ